jgi:hypothetical protein
MEKGYLLKLVLKWRAREIKENGGWGEFKYDVVDNVSNFVNATMQPYPAQQ